MAKARNVLNSPLQTCGTDPLTGFYRSGCCDTGGEDVGIHVVCAEMTAEFLAFSASRGNDLSTAARHIGFPACARRSLVSVRRALARGFGRRCRSAGRSGSDAHVGPGVCVVGGSPGARR